MNMRSFCKVWLLAVGCMAWLGHTDLRAQESTPSVKAGEQPAAKPAEQPADDGPARPGLGERLRRFREMRDRGGEAGASELKRMTWQIEGATREALVYLPPKAAGDAKSAADAKPAPLVFVFHGHGGKAEFSVRKFAVHEHWPEAIAVYPQGLPTAVPTIDPQGLRSGWQKHAGDQDDRDLKFYDAMLKTLSTEHAVDAKRVYSTGHSNGGFFTYVLWAARSETLAAVAPVAANVNPRDLKTALSPKPVLHVAGEKDPIVRYAGQVRTMEYDRQVNGCDAEGKPAGEFCTEYRSKDGPVVITYIHPGGHEVPDGAPQRIVEFFRSQGTKK